MRPSTSSTRPSPTDPPVLPQLAQRGAEDRTLVSQRGDLDATLLAAAGFGNTGGDVFERGAPYFVRLMSDLVPTSKLLDTYSPSLHCMIRNYAEVLPLALSSFGQEARQRPAFSRLEKVLRPLPGR